jgi:predicted ATP-grasp superfamily ATP-dependent carboligase
VSKIDIPFPSTCFPGSEADINVYNGDFPCIIKPAIMHTFYNALRKKVLLCRDKTELLENYKLATRIIPSGEIMIQEIIPGDSRNQFSACFFSINGDPIVSLTACRMRQHPLDFGNATTYAETVDNIEILEAARKVLKNSTYTGICEIEFKRDERDQKYKFLEVNARTWKWHLIGTVSGSPFLPCYYKYLNGEFPEKKNSFTAASFRHGLTDFYVQMQMLFKGIPQWRKNLKPQISAVWDPDDIKPWIYEKLYIFNFIRTR